MATQNVDIRLDFPPNPNAVKYILDEFVFLERGSANFTNKEATEASPLAKRVLDIPGVASCMIGYNFITVVKTNDGDWEFLDLRTREAIRSHIASGEPAVNPLSLDKQAAPSNESDLEKRIRDVLDKEIRPAVAMDGGDIIFEKFEAGIVYLYMQGSCSGCPSSTATLKFGIESRLKNAVPEVLEVVAL